MGNWVSMKAGIGGQLRMRKWLDVKEVQPREALEIPIEGDETAACSKREGRQIGICPEMMGESGRARQRAEVVVETGRFRKETKDRKGEKLLVNDPRFLWAERIGECAGMGAQAQEAH